jgi:hypothetical protein
MAAKHVKGIKMFMDPKTPYECISPFQAIFRLTNFIRQNTGAETSDSRSSIADSNQVEGKVLRDAERYRTDINIR